MQAVRLDNGMVAFIDDEDAVLVARRVWRTKQTQCCVYAVSGGVFMHRLIMGNPQGHQIDHVNGNGLDNRRENLRLATPSQNGANRKIQRNNTSGFRGVSLHGKRWYACIKKDGRKRALGYFDTREEAAAAYNHAALLLFGEFARLNPLPEVAPMA